MHITDLKERDDLQANAHLNNAFTQLQKLLVALNRKPLTPNVIASVNQDVAELNMTSLTGHELRKSIKQTESKIIKLVERELKIVPKNHYQNLWLVIGMSSFGLPLGLVFGLLMDNMGLMAIGLPIGMAVGIAVGSEMDKKAFKTGRQLDVVIRY